MTPEAVEIQEQRFQRKVGELRSHLSGRQQSYRRKRQVRLGFKALVLVLLMVAGYWVTAISMFTEQPVSAPAPTPPTAIPAQGPVRALERSAAAVADHRVTAAVPVPAVEPPVAPLPALSDAVAVAREAPLSPEPAPPGKAPQDAPPPAVAVAAPDATSMPRPPSAGIRIASRLVCRGVSAHECVGSQAVFALHKHANPHVWMDVRSRALPYVLTHVYYHDGQKYGEVPLAITYPRMRTWSNVTLRSPTYVGSWRVEIVTEDGTVLDQLTFRVIP